MDENMLTTETAQTGAARPVRPLMGKSYGSIPSLIGSRRGPMDKGVNSGQQRICTERARDRHDTIIVQEKLDGSNVAAALLNGQVVALTRGGNLAQGSGFVQHQLWALGSAARRQVPHRLARRRAIMRRVAGSGARHPLQPGA